MTTAPTITVFFKSTHDIGVKELEAQVNQMAAASTATVGDCNFKIQKFLLIDPYCVKVSWVMILQIPLDVLN